MNTYTITPIGYIKTCFPEKFGVPRQSLLAPSATGKLELLAPFNNPDSVDGLEQASHIWLSFIFHQHSDKEWKAKVKPPRMGGNKKIGVFATRSSFRPNQLGLSVVRLDKVETGNGKIILHLSGIDLIDGTPIVDIKPYLPYADIVHNAHHRLAHSEPGISPVEFSTSALEFISQYEKDIGVNLKAVATEVLQQNPQPAYHHSAHKKIYGTKLYDCNMLWTVNNDKKTIEVISIALISG